MEKRPNSEKKRLATSLAASIYKNELRDDELQQVLRKLSSENEQSELDKSGKTIDRSELTKVGIWRADFEEGKKVFVRDLQFSDEFVYWADVPKIGPKSDRSRIVMLGESVARGWPLDPGYNPCISLKEIFSKAGFEIDIVDLARTNCGILDLKRLAYECLELEPDALVIFGGNNWIVNCQNRFTTEHSLIEGVVGEVARNSYEALKNSIQGIITEEISSLFELLGKISKAKNLPVFVINPEFNLRDWHSNDLEKLPLFNADGMLDWYQTCIEATDALENGNLEKAELLSDQLIGLFPSNPQGYELKATCQLAAGREKEAKKHYRQAVETKIYQTSCPGITTSMQEQIRAESRLHGLFLIDLPLVFEEYSGGRIPGREIFLDYCHLTVEGINISMYHLALNILSEVYHSDMPLPLNDIIQMGHDNLNDAKSHFLVAIHNAHWGQDFEIIYYHCKKALSYHDISDYMLAYVKAMNSTCPGRLNQDFGLLVESGIFSTYILLTLQSNGTETFDLTLCTAIMKALADVGIDEIENINSLRIKEHFEGLEKVDLLKSYYHNGYKYNLSNKLKKLAYYREYFKNSSFFILSDGKGQGLNLEIIHRFPHSSDGIIGFELNGVQIGTAHSGKNWSKESLNIPGNILVQGLNTFTIHWPLAHVSNATVNRARLSEHTKGLERLHAQMYPVVGEIHSLQLTYKGTPKKEQTQLSERAALVATVDLK